MIVYAVNSYIERLLKQKLDWTDINDLAPIIPSQQLPEFMNGGKPFAAYIYSEEFNNSEVQPMASVVITYAIYGLSAGSVNDAAQLIFDAFKAFDSAQNINNWINSPLNELDPIDTRDKVSYTQSMNLDSAGPVESEGGRHLSVVQLRVGYRNHSTENFDVSL